MSEPYSGDSDLYPPAPGKLGNDKGWFQKNGFWFIPLHVIIVIGIPGGWMFCNNSQAKPPAGEPNTVPKPAPCCLYAATAAAAIPSPGAAADAKRSKERGK